MALVNSWNGSYVGSRTDLADSLICWTTFHETIEYLIKHQSQMTQEYCIKSKVLVGGSFRHQCQCPYPYPCLQKNIMARYDEQKKKNKKKTTRQYIMLCPSITVLAMSFCRGGWTRMWRKMKTQFESWHFNMIWIRTSWREGKSVRTWQNQELVQVQSVPCQ